ncbi:MAG: bifunctional diaminohydroxyphosphoribosylaminopyrimidine deaminase/5-amino-6-(5-phosphoribosylamino)uracil reductase RibD, partial [Bacillota bacterium]|nr:bifunctional diaminohydroxyphosphoribosylaminopyrimidine deaminase/5-amino-6-(5-phosphoribosylamino)uracil reductase RibD [Bacillota bacterium]
MQLALDLAVRARGRTSPNPMVGSVIVRDGAIVGQGWHHRASEPHAEVLALRDAGEAARGSTMYVSLEPCCHTGRTGPCTEAVIGAGVSKVVVAMRDPNPLVAGKGITRLREAGIEVEENILESEAMLLNEVFIKFITKKLPFVVLKAAVSLDGKIATRTG